MDLDDSLAASIERVLDALAGLRTRPLYADVVPRPGPPADPRAIAVLEARLGLPLPPSYRRFLEWHDGYSWLAYPGHMLSVQALSPGGDHWDDIVRWKRETAQFGQPEVLDGLVIAYLEQPNNWVYLDPDQPMDDGEWAVVLHVPGVDPEVYPDVPAFLMDCASNAQQSLQWSLAQELRGRR